MLTKTTVSRNATWSEIWSDSRVVKKMSAVCVVSFYFITHSVIHPQLSEPFGSYRWALENDRGGGGRNNWSKIIPFWKESYWFSQVFLHSVNLKLSAHSKPDSCCADCFHVKHQDIDDDVCPLMNHMLSKIFTLCWGTGTLEPIRSLWFLFLCLFFCRTHFLFFSGIKIRDIQDVWLIHKLLSSKKIKVFLSAGSFIFTWCLSLPLSLAVFTLFLFLLSRTLQ